MDSERASEHPAWPLRAVFLLALGAATGLAIHFLIDGESAGQHLDDATRTSFAVALGVAGLLFAFTVERLRWTWSVAAAIAAGAVVGFVAYWNGSGNEWGSSETWQFASSLFAIGVAAPLFQSARDSGSLRFDYRSVHAHAWGNVVLWCAAWAFLAIVVLLLLLLGGLFDLIGLDLLRRLMEKSWFVWTVLGGALGAAVGLLRDRDRILLLLQRVVMAVLSVLAPILAFGLVFFLLALPFTGLAPLWNETKSTTPILLTCIVGAILLANAVIGNGPEEESKARPLRWSAMALGGAMLPLAIVAAVSTGLRIGQYGLTPERLWAAVFVGTALACALAYLAALVFGRSGWAERVRRYNIVIAIGLCLLALVLALPIVPFGALSVSDQVARLESGRVSPQHFDWPALRFDFGPAGVPALERLRAHGASPDIRRMAAEALKVTNRWDLAGPAEAEAREEAIGKLRILPAAVPLPRELAAAIKTRVYVGENSARTLLYRPGDDLALLVSAPVCETCEATVIGFHRKGAAWSEQPGPLGETVTKEQTARLRAALERGEAEVREVKRRQLFVGGQAVGEVFQ
jgi:hypothetical protein